MSQLTELFTVASYFNNIKSDIVMRLKVLENNSLSFDKEYYKKYIKSRENLTKELSIINEKIKQVMIALKEDVEEIYNYDSSGTEQAIEEYLVLAKKIDEIKKQENKRDKKLAKV